MLHRLSRLLGACWFALALIYALYTFAVVWAASPAATDTTRSLARHLAINAAAFAAFGLHHSLFARTRLKRWLDPIVREEQQRTLFVWVASLLLLGVLVGWRPIGGLVYSAEGPVALLLLAGQLLGLALIAGAVRVIDPLELAGLREARAAVQVAGPYRWVRHPIYSGFLLAVWLPATMTGDRLWFACLSTMYLLAAVPLEERTMQRRLGAPYQSYCRQVRWRLLPGIY